MKKPKRLNSVIEQMDLDTTEIPSGSSNKASTSWQEDDSGVFMQGKYGTRLYKMRKIDQLIPLGQFFDTDLKHKYQNARLDDFQTSYDTILKRNKKYAVGYVKKYKELDKGYYLHSETPGSGKTMLACCILNGIAQRHEATTQAITTIEFFKRLKWTYGDEDRSEKSVINPILAVDVLLFDDCGSEKHSEWNDEQFYHVINARMNKGKPTFFTSNYSIDELPYEDRTKSRINAITAQIPMPETDIRALVAKKDEQDFLKKVSDSAD